MGLDDAANQPAVSQVQRERGLAVGYPRFYVGCRHALARALHVPALQVWVTAQGLSGLLGKALFQVDQVEGVG